MSLEGSKLPTPGVVSNGSESTPRACPECGGETIVAGAGSVLVPRRLRLEGEAHREMRLAARQLSDGIRRRRTTKEH